MRSRSASAENSQVLSTKVREEISESSGCKSQLLSAKVAREVRSHGSGQSCTRSAFPQQLPLWLRSRKCFRAKAACEARSRSSSSNIATSIFKRECDVRKVRSRISSSKIATCRRKSSAPSTLLQLKPQPKLHAEWATEVDKRKGHERLGERGCEEGPSRIASCAASCTASCATSRAASCATKCQRSIMRNITRSFTRSGIKTHRSAQEKLTEFVFSMRGAKLAHQNLQQLRRDIDVFTLVFHLQWERCQSLFNVFLCFRATRLSNNPNTIWGLWPGELRFSGGFSGLLSDFLSPRCVARFSTVFT